MIGTGGQPTLARKILLSISLASIGFLTALSILVHYANERLEYDLLEGQISDELDTLRKRLQDDPNAELPQSANLQVFLGSRQARTVLPEQLAALKTGVYHDVSIEGRDYHIVVTPHYEDIIYLQYDITDIEQAENLLTVILLISWVVMITLVLILAKTLGRNLAEPLARLSQEISQLSPNQRGAQLDQNAYDGEVGKIADAFDLYLRRMDEYVEKQYAFSAMASHELRSPMTIVQTSADLIEYQHQDTATRQQIEKIRRATRGMSDTIDALLHITRDQEPTRSSSTVRLYELINEVLEWLQPELQLKKLTVSNRVDKQAEINANHSLLMVVCTNLIKNAVKHASDKDINIEWRQPTLNIIDNGLGIDLNDLEHIFDFAHRGQSSQGYGIGLYVSKLICDHQAWILELSPNPEGGIRASVTFA